LRAALEQLKNFEPRQGGLETNVFQIVCVRHGVFRSGQKQASRYNERIIALQPLWPFTPCFNSVEKPHFHRNCCTAVWRLLCVQAP
jgi:hypothetical protein